MMLSKNNWNALLEWMTFCQVDKHKVSKIVNHILYILQYRNVKQVSWSESALLCTYCLI